MEEALEQYKSMKVCLIHPRSPFLIDETVFPPLGLWYVAAAIKKLPGHEVTICDMAFNDPIPRDADIYGITGTSPQADGMRNLVKRLRTMNPQAWIMAGGPHATLAPHEVLDYGCDAVLCGEAEEEIMHMTRDRWGAIVISRRITNLDDVPFPDRTHALRYRYLLDGLLTTSMMTSRGCPYQCAFCCKPLGKQLCMRSVDNIMEEVWWLRKEYGFRALMFYDDTLAIDKERLGELCQELATAGITWRCLLRSHEVTPEIAQAMKEGGCVEVGIGIESGNDQILANIQKGETVEQIERGIRVLKQVGIRVKGFFIIGLPGEDTQSLAATEAFLERVPLDDVDFTILNVYPGSPIHKEPDRYDLQWVNGTAGYYKADPDKYQCAVRTSALSEEELLQARKHLERRFKKWH